MTTLAEARNEIHELTARRMNFLTRKAGGELVRKFAADSAAASWVRADRDRILDFPIRHSAILAAEFHVDSKQMLDALEAVLRAFCSALAGATAPDAQPLKREDRPERPVVKRASGYFPSYVDNEWATAWRLAHPVEAQAEADWEAKILDYFQRHSITPQPGDAGYAVWCHARGMATL
jgi:hypothetical protein